MKSDKNKLKELVSSLEWQIAMGADAMIEENQDKKNYIPNDQDDSEKYEKQISKSYVANNIIEDDIREINNTYKELLLCSSLEKLKNLMMNFDGCDLKKTATQLVFSDGNPDSKIMLIGEAPGAEEDRKGKPFCGASGKLLDKMLASINLHRKNVYITNVIPWRPPGNRTPTENEIKLMEPFLMKHVEIISPKIIVAIGGSSAKTLLNYEGGILRHRGIWKELKLNSELSIPIIATLHPAYLLRAPNQKKLAWEDLKSIRSKVKDLNIITSSSHDN